MREPSETPSHPAPLQQLEQAWRSGVLGPQDADQVANSLHLPVASVRGVISWYADLHADPNAIRVCRGTSCMLAGAQALVTTLAAEHRWRHVYCVGYCDRSPAILMPNDRVVIHCRSANALSDDMAAPPTAPSVRCAAREPIVTGRLLCGGCSELAAARAAGVYASFERALQNSPDELLETIEQAGLRGRGGAGFSTGRKWRACAQTPGECKYVIANGDEGDPGSFIDRELMECDPHSILEGMLLAAYAVGAREGIVFIRSEYPRAIETMSQAIADARSAGLLCIPMGRRTLAFDARVITGLGSYVCGEETALLNAIEGKRGEARPRPPYPVEQGLHGRPTVVDNVETLVNVPWIVRNGAQCFRTLGTIACPGTKALCLNHGFAQPGIVEVEFGVSLREVIVELAEGAAAGQELEAVLLGGPMGSIVLSRDWDVPVCLDTMAQRGFPLGHGGIVALPNGTDYSALLLHMLEFMAEESCGKCVPCRIGTKRAFELVANEGLTRSGAETLARIFHLMEQSSMCGFGRETPAPVRQLIEQFGARIVTEARR